MIEAKTYQQWLENVPDESGQVLNRNDAEQVVRELEASPLPEDYTGQTIYAIDTYENFIALYQTIREELKDPGHRKAILRYGDYLFWREYLEDLVEPAKTEAVEPEEVKATEPEEKPESSVDSAVEEPWEQLSMDDESSRQMPVEEPMPEPPQTDTSEEEQEEPAPAETETAAEDQEETGKELLDRLCEEEMAHIHVERMYYCDERTAFCSVILKYMLDIPDRADRLDQIIEEPEDIDFVSYDEDEQKVILSCVVLQEDMGVTSEELLDMLNEMWHQLTRLTRNTSIHRQKRWQKLIRNMLDQLPDNDTDNVEYHMYSRIPIDEEELKKLIEADAENNIPEEAVHIYQEDKIEKAVSMAINPLKTVQKDQVILDRENNCLSYESDDLRGIFCNVSSFSISNLYQKYAGAGLFDLNIRKYIRNSLVDSGINKTLEENRQNFWFLNNGIIIACRNFTVKGDEVSLEHFSIVNGGQTTTLVGTYQGKNHEEFFIPCKIVAPRNEQTAGDFFTKIAEASNSQKPIYARDLKSNTPEMRRLSQELEREKVHLEIKRSYRPAHSDGILLKNDEFGQLVLSFILQRPGTARSGKKLIFENQQLYESIFKVDYFQDSNRRHFILDLIHLNVALKSTESTLKKEYLSNAQSDQEEIIKNAHQVILALLGLMYRLVNKDLSIYTLLRKPAIVAQEPIIYGQFLGGQGEDLARKMKRLTGLLVNVVAGAYAEEASKGMTSSVSNFLKTDQKYYSTIVTRICESMKDIGMSNSLMYAANFLVRKNEDEDLESGLQNDAANQDATQDQNSADAQPVHSKAFYDGEAHVVRTFRADHKNDAEDESTKTFVDHNVEDSQHTHYESSSGAETHVMDEPKHYQSDTIAYAHNLHSLEDDTTKLSFTKPKKIYIERTGYAVSSWADMIPAVCRWLKEKDEDKFNALMKSMPEQFYIARSKWDLPGNNSKRFNYTKISDSIYVYTRYSAAGTVSAIKRIMKKYDSLNGTDYESRVQFELM